VELVTVYPFAISVKIYNLHEYNDIEISLFIFHIETFIDGKKTEERQLWSNRWSYFKYTFYWIAWNIDCALSCKHVHMLIQNKKNIWLNIVTLHSLPWDNMATSSQDVPYHCIWCSFSNIPYKNCDRWSWWLMLSLAVRVGSYCSWISMMWWMVGMMWPIWAHWGPRQRGHWRTRYHLQYVLLLRSNSLMQAGTV
jgi:hypothetical protein